jgi:hypothetical protein
MGCHTSFYEKSEIQLPRLTKKVKKQIINFLHKRYSNLLYRPKRLKKYYHIKRFKQSFDYSTYILLLVDWSDLLAKWFIEGILKEKEEYYQYLTKEKLLLELSYGDIFRVWDYPNDVLKSYQDYLDFKKKYPIDDIWFCESEQKCDEIIKEFFDDGGYLIEFG